MNHCDHIECRDYQTCAFDRGREGGLKAGDECHELRERIAGLRKELADEKVSHAATRKSLKELEDRFFQTLLHGTPRQKSSSMSGVETYEAELRAAGIDLRLLTMCAEGAIAHAKMVEAERDDLQKRLDKAVDILNARHLGAGAMAANEKTREAALEFIRVELKARKR